MRHHIFETSVSGSYAVALLMKGNAFHKQELLRSYVNPLFNRGLPSSDVIAFTLEYNNVGKAPAAHIKAYLEELMPELNKLGVQYLYVADSNYFKALTKQLKADVHHGYVMPCKFPGCEHMKVVLGTSYTQLIYNPDLQHKLDGGLFALTSDMVGAYQAPGTGIIHSAQYPESLGSIQAALNDLHQYPSLEVDIEAFSLRFNEAGIGTISFAWDKHNGIAFACDYNPNVGNQVDDEGYYGRQFNNTAVRRMLKEFFCTYKGKLTFHNATYDVKVILYVLWMKDLLDQRGLLEGLDIMTRDLEDTKIIAYLATNSTAGNILGLKHLAHEFAGNWAKDDIKDIKKIPLPELLQYNLVDSLSTNYVREKYTPIMVADNQEDIYREMFLPSLKVILQMELTGMPMSIKKLAEVKDKLTTMQNGYLSIINNSAVIKTMNVRVQTKAMIDANAKLKVKQHPFEKFAAEVFNPNSGPQLQVLLYDLMGLPVIDLTDTKLPATGGETIEKLINHTTNPEYKAVLEALMGYGGVNKILSTFIPAFEKGIIKAKDGIIWLHGSFNLGGTVSGRLSSSDPNLQNLPATSEFGKVIKEIFTAPKGWLFCGADFNSLEDMISALTTKDPAKLAVYEQGFDGHCLRAAYYFKDQLIAEGIIINLTDAKSVNSLKKMPQYGGKDHPVRQESKAPTFALTYQGTYHTLMANLGWSEEKSKAIEKGYHDLYAVSDQYIQARLKQASVDGYVEVAFGLRLRTPLLKQVVFGASRMPYEAAAEGRTAGNAMGQSYGLLNNRAAVDFWSKVWASKYRYDILPVAWIHDAVYPLIRDDVEILEWANSELIKSMQWQKLPEIQHPTVKLGAALDIFWPGWHNGITLPNNATAAEIVTICKDAKHEYLNPKPKKE
jgi:DNA polymerase-1